MGTENRRQREFQRREREILDAALPLLNGDSWMSVTVEQIAEAAEVGKGTVYKHFASKEEIYGRLALEFHRGVLQDLKGVDSTLDLIGSVRAIVRVFWKHYWGRREYQAVVEYTSRENFRRTMSSGLKKAFDEFNAEQDSLLAGVLEEGMKQGVFRRQPLEQAFLGPQAMINGLILMIWSGCFENAPDERFLSDMTDFMLAGMMYQHKIRESGADAA
jgi:AcrR family transcriptional regulator